MGDPEGHLMVNRIDRNSKGRSGNVLNHPPPLPTHRLSPNKLEKGNKAMKKRLLQPIRRKRRVTIHLILIRINPRKASKEQLNLW